jgi:hypothetical protein
MTFVCAHSVLAPANTNKTKNRNSFFIRLRFRFKIQVGQDTKIFLRKTNTLNRIFFLCAGLAPSLCSGGEPLEKPHIRKSWDTGLPPSLCSGGEPKI